MSASTHRFADDFVWGVASSAYQIEGATERGGRGPSIWDAFAERRGVIQDGTSGRHACRHYEHWQSDLDLIAGLGVSAYRFSVAWPRVMPGGRGEVNREGIGFYDRLVDGLLERGVTPWLTLYHWDMPLELLHMGGWLNRSSADWFADYTRVVVDALGDRVEHWITLNEPQCFIGLGHHTAVHAPGIPYPRSELLLATHHSLLAHGRAVQVIRERAQRSPVVGWSPVGWVSYPLSEEPECIDAARRLMFTIGDDPKLWPFNNSWYSDPVVLGHYPEEGIARFGRDVPRIVEGDLDVISTPLDFYGVNIYHGIPITFSVDVDGGEPVAAPSRQPGHPETLMGWTVDPDALYWGPRFLAERYKLPIYITENGIASMDWVHTDDQVHDPARIDYLTRHLIALRRAIADGVDIRGYFHWSIMDNFEWELGYSKRFGLTYVDYRTQQRIPKDSYCWYRELIAQGGETLPREISPLR